MASFDIGENQSVLVSELSLIQQLVMQLESQLKEPSNSTVPVSKSIVSQLLSQTEKSIFLAKSCGFRSNPGAPASPPRSMSASPRSDMSDLAFKSQDNKREVSKKRKTLPRWRNQVRVGSAGGVEGPLDDGHSWRKYGQKDILGAKHPRSYYRCTNRNSQGCLATKQVQRTDEDPAVFDVIYQGTHTCTSGSGSGSGSSSISFKRQRPRQSNQDQDCCLNTLKATLSVDVQTQENMEAQEFNSLSFSFPSIGTGHVSTATDGLFLPSFANSPATSESNYHFSVSPCGYGAAGIGQGLVDSDLTDLISSLSAATSATNSPMGDMDPVFDGLDFDTNFQIEPSNYFSSLP